MRDLVYVVAFKRKDGRLPTSEKVAESRFFAEEKLAQECADYYNSLQSDSIKPYKVYAAIIEIVNDPS